MFFGPSQTVKNVAEQAPLQAWQLQQIHQQLAEVSVKVHDLSEARKSGDTCSMW